MNVWSVSTPYIILVSVSVGLGRIALQNFEEKTEVIPYQEK